MGYFFGVKKKLAEKWNIYFDENLIRYAYAEDLDFTMRYCSQAHKEKFSCILNTDIYVNHLVSQEWRTPSITALYFLIANRIYLLKKNCPQIPTFPMKWNNWLYCKSLPKADQKNFKKVQQICKKNRKLLEKGEIQKVLELQKM